MEQFKQFLKENNLLKQYLRNRIIYDKEAGSLNEFCEITDTEDYVLDAFKWKYTPEQSFFWEVIHNNWIEQCAT